MPPHPQTPLTPYQQNKRIIELLEVIHLELSQLNARHQQITDYPREVRIKDNGQYSPYS